MANWVLPYPSQLPQDYYTKNLPSGAPSVAPPTQPPSAATPDPDPIATINNGGIWYGDNPPDNPSNGWLWANSQGSVFIYMDPGVWSQIGTNW
jgi:hypothetical protein